MKALLALEDGKVFWGRSVGVPGERSGEVVFNTSMTGYGEILTDPSYRGQLVTLTTSHVGNYGVNAADLESERPWAEALLVRSFSDRPSNWRAEESLHHFLVRHNVMAIADLDTRALTRHIREAGALRGVLSTEDLDPGHLVARARAVPSMEGLDLASGVGTRAAYEWYDGLPSGFPPGPGRSPGETSLHVVVLDFGVKRNTLRRLVDLGCRVTVIPGDMSAEEIFALQPHGILISNGPGDPATLGYAVEAIRALLGRVAILGICLGHQLLGQAFGARTYKLPFGHHGGNHPVRDTRTGRVRITAQNHGFAVDPDQLPAEVEVTEVSGNDGACEGLRHRALPAFSVQYHPEAGPGPHDGDDHLRAFVEMLHAEAN